MISIIYKSKIHRIIIKYVRVHRKFPAHKPITYLRYWVRFPENHIFMFSCFHEIFWHILIFKNYKNYPKIEYWVRITMEKCNRSPKLVLCGLMSYHACTVLSNSLFPPFLSFFPRGRRLVTTRRRAELLPVCDVSACSHLESGVHCNFRLLN